MSNFVKWLAAAIVVPVLVTYLGWLVTKEKADPPAPRIEVVQRGVDLSLQATMQGQRLGYEWLLSQGWKSPEYFRTDTLNAPDFSAVSIIQITNHEPNIVRDIVVELPGFKFTTASNQNDTTVLAGIEHRFTLKPDETVTISGLLDGTVFMDGEIRGDNRPITVSVGDRVIPIRYWGPPQGDELNFGDYMYRYGYWYHYLLLFYASIVTTFVTFWLIGSIFEKAKPAAPANVPTPEKPPVTLEPSKLPYIEPLNRPKSRTPKPPS